MDRRGFLRLFSAAALSAIAPVDQLIAFDDSRFESPALRFSFEIPPGWYRPSLDELRGNLARQTFVEENRQEDAFAPTPLVAVWRDREPCPQMNPGVFVYADRIQPRMGTPLHLAQLYLRYFSQIVENAQCLQPPAVVPFAGLEAASVALAYRGVIASENWSHEVLDESRIVYHRDFVLWFLFEQSLHDPERSDDDFGRLVRSLRFT